MATLSIIGLYNYDNSIFDLMQIPAALDRQTLIDNLLMECGVMETYIPDPAIMKRAVGYWSAKCIEVWEALQKTKEYNYNPIWNKDGVFTEKETRNLKGTGKTGTVNAVSAYDQAGFTNQAKGDVDASTTDTGTITRERTEKGNIGVTTTQQMIKEEREVQDFNIYDVIIQDFKHRFCVMVY